MRAALRRRHNKPQRTRPAFTWGTISHDGQGVAPNRVRKRCEDHDPPRDLASIGTWTITSVEQASSANFWPRVPLSASLRRLERGLAPRPLPAAVPLHEDIGDAARPGNVPLGRALNGLPSREDCGVAEDSDLEISESR